MKSWLCVFVGLTVLLSSCGSSSRRQKPLSEMTMAERRSYGLKAMKEGYTSTDSKYRSRFDKSATSALAQGRRGSAGWFSRQKHSAQDFNGVKLFNAGENYQTKSFSGSDDQSWMGRKVMSESDKTPAFADDQFAARQSPFADDQARESGQVSRMADDVFKTSANRAATRSQKKNQKPLIIELPEQKNPAYNEDQVKALLGRD